MEFCDFFENLTAASQKFDVHVKNTPHIRIPHPRKPPKTESDLLRGTFLFFVIHQQ